jgi:hypothetical protein
VVLTGPQAAAGLIQRLAGKTVGFDIETHGAPSSSAPCSGARSVRPLRRRECRDSRDPLPPKGRVYTPGADESGGNAAPTFSPGAAQGRAFTEARHNGEA